MSWTNRPSYPLDCGRVFDWERQKLAVDVDLRPTSGLRRPDDATPEAERGVPRPVKLPGPIAGALDKSLGAGARNMNGQFLMRGRKQPFQRMLDQKLEQVLDKPRSRAAMQGFPPAQKSLVIFVLTSFFLRLFGAPVSSIY